jgi:hypothetical protein
MAVSGTSTFNLDIAELCEEAYERAGLEMRSGYDLATARRSLNLMGLEWANRGINLWLVEEGSVTLVTGTATYTLPSDTIDLLEHTLRTDSGETDQTDTALYRMSVSTYSQITNKLTQGKPTQIYINRLRDAPTVTLWPIPNSTYNGDFVRYFRLRRVEDMGAKSSNTSDIPARFLPCMVAGLAYHIAMKRPEAAPRIQMLKSVYDEQFELAAQEDREKASWSFTPQMDSYSL